MQLSREDLDAAVAAGVIDNRARERLILFAAARTQDAAGPDSENFRLLTGFNDIFVSLACGLLLLAVGLLVPGLAGPAAVAAASWGLAEYFTARRRLALPSILLLVVFVGSVFRLLFTAVAGAADWSLAVTSFGFVAQGQAFFLPMAVAGAGAAAAAALHWWRFRVPITLAAGAAGATVLLLALVGALGLTSKTPLLLAMLIAGLAVFALAMRYDMADRARLTRNTDIAFWLHLLAAPLIVHPVFSLTGLASGQSSAGAVLAVLGVYLLLTLVALAIDRRALLVSALAYVLFALQALLEAGRVAAGFGLTALILGGFLVTLSAAWPALRRQLLAVLPASLRAVLPVPA